MGTTVLLGVVSLVLSGDYYFSKYELIIFLDIEVYYNHVICELFINYCYITENKWNPHTCISTGWSLFLWI